MRNATEGEKDSFAKRKSAYLYNFLSIVYEKAVQMAIKISDQTMNEEIPNWENIYAESSSMSINNAVDSITMVKTPPNFNDNGSFGGP